MTAPAHAVLRPPPTSRAPARHHRTAAPRSLPLNVLVSDVMSSPAVAVPRDAPLFDALVVLRTHGFSGVPVEDDAGRVVGVLSERDIARVFAEALSMGEVKALLDVLLVGLVEQPTPSLRYLRERLEESRVEEAMTAPAYVTYPEAPLELAAEVMVENGIDRLPVVEHDRLVGILTRHDVLRALVGAKPA